MNRRAVDVGRAGLAATALGLLLAGPPLALSAAVGWPLPRTAPDLRTIGDAINVGLGDDVIVKTLAVIAWIAWAQIALAILVELDALRRRRPARHLPVLPGLQPTIARLVAACILIAATSGSRTPTAAAIQAPPPPAPLIHDPAPVPAPVVTPPVDPTAPARPTVPAPTVVVERHDSYWAIAERTLGDGLRWRDLRDANVGHRMPDGHVITGDSDLLHPGWVLELPATDQPPAPVPAATSTTPPADRGAIEAFEPNGIEVTVERGDHFWSLATEQVEAQLGRPATAEEIHPYWSALVTANTDRLTDPTNPSLLYPGQHLTLVALAPPAPTATPAAPEPPPPPAPPPPPGPVDLPPNPTTAPQRADPPATHPAPTTDDDTVSGATEEDHVPFVAATAGFTALLAIGATRRLLRLRRRRAHLRLAPDPPTSPPVAHVHRELLVAADEPAVDDLHGHLVRLAAAIAEHGIDTRPSLVQHGAGHLDAHLTYPAVPPPASGWDLAEGTDSVWAPTTARRVVDPDAPAPAPLLVTLGRPDDGGQLYLDLEAHPTVALTGDPHVARDIARTIAAELALTPLADTIDVLLVGDLDTSDIGGLDHVRCYPSWEDIAEDLTAWVTQTHAALEANRWTSPFAARALEPAHDVLAPLAVVAACPPPKPVAHVLFANHPAVVGVVVLGGLDGAFEIECWPDRLELPSLGIAASPHPLEPADVAAVVALLDEPGLEPVATPTLFEASDDSAPEAPPSYEVTVRVLGDIRVDDVDLTAKQTAVLAYIATHGAIAAERIEDAVWAAPSSGSRRKRLANTISEIRAAIGRQHLPPAADGRYRTGPGVGTDAAAFDHLIRSAAAEPPQVAAELLRAALELVTGPVFTYRTTDRASYTWVDLENLVSTWELRIAAAAQRCTDLHTELGRGPDAVEIASRALTIIPTHPGITEALMRAHAANGDRLAIHRVFQAHASALEQLDLDDVADTTAELYEQLANGSK